MIGAAAAPLVENGYAFEIGAASLSSEIGYPFDISGAALVDNI